MQYEKTIGFYAPDGRGFFNPVDFALGRGEIIYVLNRVISGYEFAISPKRITIVSLAEEFLGQFSSTGTGDDQLAWPVSIAIDKDENVYVSDEGLHRISIFDKQGQYLSKWGVNGNGDGEFDGPAGITFDGDDNLLVVDSVNNRIQRYARDGQFLGGWGKGGSGDGEFNLPWGITVDHVGDVYVADWRNDRIQKFDSQGKYLASWGSPGQGDGEFRRPSWVAVDQRGNMYVTDWGNERVQALGPDGSYLSEYRGEATESKWADAYFVSTPDELEERRKSDLEPPLELRPEDFLRDESANIEKLFWTPTSVKIDDEGRLYVLESCRHRIQIYHIDSSLALPPGTQG